MSDQGGVGRVGVLFLIPFRSSERVKSPALAVASQRYSSLETYEKTVLVFFFRDFTGHRVRERRQKGELVTISHDLKTANRKRKKIRTKSNESHNAVQNDNPLHLIRGRERKTSVHRFNNGKILPTQGLTI